MENFLFDHWESVAGRLRGKKVFLFLDYDGTLTPIVSRPGEAALSDRVRDILRRLAALPDCTLAIVSGRSLPDIKAMVGLENIYYAGNHGLEISGPGVSFNEGDFQERKDLMTGLRRELEKNLTPIKGALIEDKGLTLSVHYRMVGPEEVAAVRAVVEDVVGPARSRGQVKIAEGKKVLEVRPAVGWDKGSVVAWFLDHAGFAPHEMPVGPIYVGDDTTDEDAFRYLKDKGLTVRVGEGRETFAQYLLRDPADVFEFLKRLRALLSGSR